VRDTADAISGLLNYSPAASAKVVPLRSNGNGNGNGNRIDDRA